MAKKYPEVIVITKDGKDAYGRRQNMDITHPTYLFYAERMIRKLMEVTRKYDHIIGYQIDNETKHYDTSSENVHDLFVEYLRKKFGTTDAMNQEFGFNYWSNRIDSWEHVPSAVGTINGSFGAEFSKFQRTLVDKFLMWQSNIVREYIREGQFITQNFDYEWRGHSYGVQPDVNHKTAAEAVTIAGCDIYHNTQSALTGKEIAFGGDICRSLKDSNYLLIETEAQGQIQWLPYNGQIRLQAFSHVASGANAVMYWHWHSIHNSFETYWRGILSHDLKPNRVFHEVSTVGRDFKNIGKHLVNLKKENKVAVLVSNESLTGMDWFETPDGKMRYNDFFRWIYDALYELNVEVDIVFSQDVARFERYEMIVIPTLYSASDAVLEALSDFCKKGGTLVATFKNGFSNEYLTVPPVPQPRGLTDCFGIYYNEYTLPVDTSVVGDDFELSEEARKIDVWMELLQPTTAQVISHYNHEHFGECAAVTENSFGDGKAYYIGCYTSDNYLKALFSKILKDISLWGVEQTYPFPVIIKKGRNDFDKQVVFIFNYSDEIVEVKNEYGESLEIIQNQVIQADAMIEIEPWGFKILTKLV